jgi:hypothetical protein
LGAIEKSLQQIKIPRLNCSEKRRFQRFDPVVAPTKTKLSFILCNTRKNSKVEKARRRVSIAFNKSTI